MPKTQTRNCHSFAIFDFYLFVGVSVLGVVSPSTATAIDPARRAVEQWLDDEPRQVRSRPPIENIDELRAEWIVRGRALPSAGDALVAVMRDKESLRRASAALVVGELIGSKALSALEELFQTDDVRLHLCALHSLRKIDDPNRIKVLSTALKSTYRQPDIEDKGCPTNAALVRGVIAVLLREAKEQSAKVVLRSLASKEYDPYVLELLESLQIQCDDP